MTLPEPVTTLWLLRHGQPVDDARGRCYGSLDLRLASEGLRAVADAARSIPLNSLKAIYSSPRTRCLQSAKVLAYRQSPKIIAMNSFAEIDFGEFEGRGYDEIAVTHPDLYQTWMNNPTEVKFPGGESFQEMQGRVLSTANELRDTHRDESYAIVAHGGVNRIILADALGVCNENIFRIAQRYAALNLIRYLGDYPSIELMNR